MTIIFFARVHYDQSEIEHMRKHDMTLGLTTDYAGRPCKDFFRVAIDSERRSEWNSALPQVKRHLENSEREILMDFHLSMLAGKEHDNEEKRILGRFSFVSDHGGRVFSIRRTRAMCWKQSTSP